jgi:hypothetical protein
VPTQTTGTADKEEFMRRFRCPCWSFNMAACTVLVVVSGSARADLIDTTTAWNGTTSVGPFGASPSRHLPGGGPYGETFTIGATNTTLDSFSFWVRQGPKGPLTVEGVIMAWNGSQPVGSPLFTSAPVITNNNGGKGGFQELTFTTGGLALNPGQQYVAILTDLGGHGRVGVVPNSGATNPGGLFVFMHNFPIPGGPPTPSWHLAPGGRNLAFQASFYAPPGVSKTPAPSGLVLGALGACGLAAFGWRGRKKHA